MNCKPNEMAFIVKSALPGFLGKVVTTLYLAPKGVPFNLPDGYPHVAINTLSPDWVCEFPRDIAANLTGGATRLTRFAPVPDKLLKPLRGDEEPEATETRSPLEKHITQVGGAS
ncbi:MAG: hypothetical protein Q8M05_13160 [Rhodoferax sp.]|uniref:hypothetical protein n=1 Tax=Rhodoferax sp. TaxID=50421 RepID=UPI0027321319|nr:hypothetical protein [Rhodoferax sp.]MDP1530324.1 hypothetical protein [Rhodoferax sp.]MDP1943330.1 hypothetical protein [Rhodoferax sp.]